MAQIHEHYNVVRNKKSNKYHRHGHVISYMARQQASLKSQLIRAGGKRKRKYVVRQQSCTSVIEKCENSRSSLKLTSACWIASKSESNATRTWLIQCGKPYVEQGWRER